MAISTTRNLKLRVDSNATIDAKYNLNKIDESFNFRIVTDDGTTVSTSSAGFLFRPNNGLGGGTVTWGALGAEITSFLVYGPVTARSITLTALGATGGVTLQPNVATGATYTLTLPVTQGLAGEYLGYTANGVLGSIALPNIQSPTLNEGNVWIGNSSNNATATDLATLGDIAAGISTGLVIKPETIRNVHLAEPITQDNLAALTANRIMMTDAQGHAAASTLTEADLIDLTTLDLPQDYVFIGNPVGVADPINTATLGDVAATVMDGLTLKDSTVLNKHFGEDIEHASMEALTAQRVMVTDATGHATVSSLTVAELEALTEITLPEGQILVGNEFDVATATTMSGDATITKGGVLTLTVPTSLPYTRDFELSDWVLDSGTYSITIPAVTHGQGSAVLVRITEADAVVYCDEVEITATQVVLKVPADVAARFAGKVVISRA